MVVIPELANASLDTASETAEEQPESIYRVTVEDSEAVPRMTGV